MSCVALFGALEKGDKAWEDGHGIVVLVMMIVKSRDEVERRFRGGEKYLREVG